MFRLEPVEAGISGLQEQPVNKWDIYNGDVEDAEFDHVLDNLPTSYDDFESKVRLLLNFESNLLSKLDELLLFDLDIVSWFYSSAGTAS